jgi:NADPH-dependent glutamate synthase beta subunit-like oxidoreductase/NAD(P)H-flavin reductase
MTSSFHLGKGMRFEDLYDRPGLLRLDGLFLAYLTENHPLAAQALKEGRSQGESLGKEEESHLILEAAPFLEEFLVDLFQLYPFLEEASRRSHEGRVIAQAKRKFVQRYALRLYSAQEVQANPSAFQGGDLRKALHSYMGEPFSEFSLAAHMLQWGEEGEAGKEALDLAARYTAWVVHTPEGQAHKGVLFSFPEARDGAHLIPHWVRTGGDISLPSSCLRERKGFSLTDPGLSSSQALDQAHYCLLCHHQQKDSCRKGLVDRHSGDLVVTPQGQPLQGCPLDQKISEMNELKRKGYGMAALGVIMIDNPMVAATGHRICNDCMKSCIFQKQDPVQVPGVETRILNDVLNLPHGWEIYSLLSRWNPLHLKRPYPRPDSGYKVLVVGMGPAGFTLAHHLLNEGHEVVGIDGLKIEPLLPSLSGVDRAGKRHSFQPLKDVQSLYEELSQRPSRGFGGVAEYGITVRWNKNYLTLIRLLLERRETFSLFGGVRLGSTLSLEDAFSLGFDHVAFCGGAGKPKTLALPSVSSPSTPQEKNSPLGKGAGSFPKGVRQAADFLMALHSGGAGRADSLTNLQLHLPLVVIGGGLTAIDAATEALAYYGVQVETFFQRYTRLAQEVGEDQVRASWTSEEKEIANLFLTQGEILYKESQKKGEASSRLSWLKKWGGVTLVYYGDFEEAASYRLNHEEVVKALEEGIQIIEKKCPVAYEVASFPDGSQAVSGVVLQDIKSGIKETIGASSVLIAVGTFPNYQFSPPGGFPKNKSSPFLGEGDGSSPVSFFGDAHPGFSGSVVKAMASAKKGYPLLTQALEKKPPLWGERPKGDFKAHLQKEWQTQVTQVMALSDKSINVTLSSPGMARAYQPGQFFRLQTFEWGAPKGEGTVWSSEPIPVSPLKVDPEEGHISFALHSWGASSRVAVTEIKEGRPLFFMGPVGQKSPFPEKEKVACVVEEKRGALGVGLVTALLERKNQVFLLGGESFLSKILADTPFLKKKKETGDLTLLPFQDLKTFSLGSQGMGEGVVYSPEEITWLWGVGSPSFLHDLSQALPSLKGRLFSSSVKAMGAASAPLQCMMQGVCGQCLHLQKDPLTGEERFVFSCEEPDQPLEKVDWKTLQSRLAQNGLLEKFSALWTETFFNKNTF